MTPKLETNCGSKLFGGQELVHLLYLKQGRVSDSFGHQQLPCFWLNTPMPAVLWSGKDTYLKGNGSLMNYKTII